MIETRRQLLNPHQPGGGLPSSGAPLNHTAPSASPSGHSRAKGAPVQSHSALTPDHDRTVIWVNGIMHSPGSADSWVRRAASWTSVNTEFNGGVFLYEAGPLTRRFTLNARARELAELLYAHRRDELHVAVHSNGGEVLSRALRHILQHPEVFMEPFVITSAHFLGPANDADFTKNWLNSALITGLVREVWVYRATKDAALGLGRVSRRLFGWIGLGYGDLGLVGPQNVAEGYQHRVHDLPQVAPCHTCFFDEQHFEKTLRLVLSNADASAGNVPLDALTR